LLSYHRPLFFNEQVELKYRVKLIVIKNNRIFFVLVSLLILIGCIYHPMRLLERFDPDVQGFAFIIPNQDVPAGVDGLRASDCGRCHQTIYMEWKNSTHASALHDIQFQSELTKHDSPKWLCLNCHIPVQNQRESIITGLSNNDIFAPIKTANPHFDSDLQQEGVTCVTCHVRTDEKTGDSYIIGPNGSQFATHPVKQDRDFLRNICQRCHNPQGRPLTENLVCWFTTTRELAEGQENLMDLHGGKRDCVDCHLPEQKRLVADNFTSLPAREVNLHHWTGSGVPKWYDGYDELLARGYKPGLDVRVVLGDHAKSDSDVTLSISLKNARSGHYLSTGDPERSIVVVAAIEDSSNQLVMQKERIGQVWKWSPARKISDNRLKQGEEKRWDVTLPLPDEREGIKVVVTAYHVRLKTETAKYIMKARDVDEKLLPNGNYLVAHLPQYYPFANYVFKEEIDPVTNQRRTYTLEELIQLSREERGKALSERDY
jgi:nitrate reductase cytochrome c-type subunit